MFFGGATQPPEQCPPSLFMSYLSCPALSIALNKVFFGESQNQTHIFLAISTQAGVKQHGGLGKLQVEELNGLKHEEQGRKRQMGIGSH